MTIFGVDVGSYQAGIDMTQVAREGFDFVLAKVGQGAGIGEPDKNSGRRANYGQSLNPAWPGQRDGARAAGMLLAGYWYIGNTEAPESQAARCRAALGDLTIPLALDWEDASGEWSNFLQVLAAFRAANLRVELGYCPNWYATAHGMINFPGTGLALWSSRYPSMTPGYASTLYQDVPASYWTGYAGSPVTILQFAASSQIASHTVDADAYQGTRDQLAALLGYSTAPTTPAPVPTAQPGVTRLIKEGSTVLLPATPCPADPSSNPRTWETADIAIAIPPIGGWLGSAAFSFVPNAFYAEGKNSTVDGFLRMAHWGMEPADPQAPQADMQPVEPGLAFDDTGKLGFYMRRFWAYRSPAAPVRTTCLVINYAAPTGASLTIERSG